MLLRWEIADFISGAVMMIVGTSDSAKMPEIGRCVGCRVLPEPDAIEVLISGWQWPDTIDNLRETGEAALTFVRPSDYRAYQLKGRATLRSCTPQDMLLCERYVTDVTAALAEQGVPPPMAAVWLSNRDLVAARIDIRSISIKTPGSDAGKLVGAHG